MNTTASTEAQAERARIGMWIFLASEIMFFGPLFFAYLVGRYELPQAFEQASRSTDLLSGTVNTAVLLTSSLSIALALKLAETGARKAACLALDATVLLACLFLAIKAHEYTQDWHEHLIPGPDFHLQNTAGQVGAQLFYFIYFISTLLHSLHLLIGIGTVLFSRARLTRAIDDKQTRRLEAVGLYWHFVDIVWIFLFPALYLVGRAQ